MTDVVHPVSDEQLPKLLAALAEAARADQRTADRFVPPRIGVLEETAARRHQFVLGRRGVGKSTLLRKPDVWYRIDQRMERATSRRKLKRLTTILCRLLAQPQIAQRTVRELQSKGAEASAGLFGGFRYRGQGAKGGVSGHRKKDTEETSVASEEQTKMDGLLSAAVLIREDLEAAQEALGERPTLIVLDGFYHVPYEDQPDVLAYLRQVVKNLNIFLKVCGVRHRLNPFVEGDPPRGMQIPQDASEISLDITLSQFKAAQSFLEAVLSGICQPLGVAIDALITEGGRQRLVLGSGGVARVQSNIFQLLGDPTEADDGTPVETLDPTASDSESGRT